MDAPPVHACKICGRTLAWSQQEQRHIHGLIDEGADHEPEPVPAEELGEDWLGRCDFCQAETPTWILPARPFAFDVVPDHGSSDDWAACEGCAKLIERNAWNALLRRVQQSWEIRQGPMPAEVYASLMQLYRQLRKNISGAIKPMSPNQTSDSGSGS